MRKLVHLDIELLHLHLAAQHREHHAPLRHLHVVPEAQIAAGNLDAGRALAHAVRREHLAVAPEEVGDLAVDPTHLDRGVASRTGLAGSAGGGGGHRGVDAVDVQSEG